MGPTTIDCHLQWLYWKEVLNVESAIGWDEGTADGAWTSAVDSWLWMAHGPGEWVKVCTCPRCAHQMTVTQRSGVVAGSVDAGSEPPPVGNRRILARCDCRAQHDGRPEGKWGCGSGGLVVAVAL